MLKDSGVYFLYWLLMLLFLYRSLPIRGGSCMHWCNSYSLQSLQKINYTTLNYTTLYLYAVHDSNNVKTKVLRCELFINITKNFIKCFQK